MCMSISVITQINISHEYVIGNFAIFLRESTLDTSLNLSLLTLREHLHGHFAIWQDAKNERISFVTLNLLDTKVSMT